MPGWIGSPKARCRRRIGAEAQQHKCRQSPSRPMFRLACGPHSAPQPTHCRTCMGTTIIPWTRDNRNRNLTGDVPPSFPAMELRKIVRPHQPDEAMIGIEPGQLGQRIDGVASLQLLLDGGRPDRRMPRHCPRGSKPRLERRHAGLLLQRVAGRDHPPDFVEIERAQGMKRQSPMPTMRRIERAPEKSDALQEWVGRFKAGSGQCRAPAICRWSAPPAPPARVRAGGRWRCRFRRPARTRHHRRTGSRRSISRSRCPRC